MFRLQEPDSATALREPVSRMQLVFDEDEDEEGREAATDQADGGSSGGIREPVNTAPPHSSWELGQKCQVLNIHVLFHQIKTLKPH